MTKSELVAKVAASAEVTQKDADKVISATLEAIKEALAAGDKVAFVGFGTFATSERKAREGRNPLTGATIKIKACKAPTFKAGKGLKDAVNAPKKATKKKK